jgi:hypothetical protein
MPDTLSSVLIGAAAGIVSAVITHFSTRAKVRLDLTAEYDKELQRSRLEAYKELWSALEPLARYGRDRAVTYSVLRAVSDQSRQWYFQTGGIYLTRASREPYFRWKAVMQPVLSDPRLQASPETPIPTPELERIVEAASSLRTSLSDDIGTKQLTRF